MKLSPRFAVMLTGTALAASGATAVSGALPATAATQAITLPQATGTRSSGITPPAWQTMTVPSSVREPATLDNVSAASTTAAWAVGAEAETGIQDQSVPEDGTPLILRWNGSAWAKAALPAGVSAPGYLNSVSVASATSAWAAGKDKSGAVVLHWNGTTWAKASFPDSATATVSAITTTPGGTVWLVGNVSVAGTTRGLVEEWNGKTWSVVNTGLDSSSLSGVSVAAHGDVWVVGAGTAAGNSGVLLADDHDGKWTEVNDSQPIFAGMPQGGPITHGMTAANSVLAVSPTDVWLAGVGYDADDVLMGPALAKWNGSSWTDVEMMSDAGQANSVSPGPGGQPQWVGLLAYKGEFGPTTTQNSYYYDDRDWETLNGATSISSVYAGATTTAHIPGTSATWAVGGTYLDGFGGYRFGGILSPVAPLIEYNSGS